MILEYERGGDLFQVLCELRSSYDDNKTYKLIKERDTGRVIFAVKKKGTKSINVLWSEDVEKMGRHVRVDNPRNTHPKERE